MGEAAPYSVTIIPYWLLSYHQWQRYNQAVILPTVFFFKANWEQFHDVCLERITGDLAEEADHLHSFVEYITKAANDCIPRTTTIPMKLNHWFDEGCREPLKARRAPDKRVWQSPELKEETISAFKRSHANARRLFNQEKRQSWAEYVLKLSGGAPIKHVWDRVGKLSGKNVCAPNYIWLGRMVLPSQTPKILLTSIQRHSQITPLPPITVLHSRP